DRMIELVTRAERSLEKANAWKIAPAPRAPASAPGRNVIAGLRGEIAAAVGGPVILAVHDDAASVAFAQRPDVGSVARRGPATPDHVIRTKSVPMVGRDVRAYVEEYKAYFSEH